MGIKSVLLRGVERLSEIRYKCIVMAGCGFEKQYQYLPEHLIRRRVLRIRTQDIKWAYRSKPVTDARLISDGDWDVQAKIPMQEFLQTNDSCHSIFQIYAEGLPYQECDQYKTIKAFVLSGVVGPGWQARGCYTVEQIDGYFAELHQSFENIRMHGYKSQAELGKRSYNDELAIAIDRAGDIQKQGGEGHHRLAMAFLLQVPVVPVIVHKIHYGWAKTQFEKHGKDLLSALILGLEELSI